MDDKADKGSITISTGVQEQIESTVSISFKSYIVELKREGVEKLLTAVYRRETTICSILQEQTMPDWAVEELQVRGLGAIADRFIDEIKTLLCNLKATERRFTVLERFYGLDGQEPARLSAIATRFGVSKERVRQIKERSLITLRGKKDFIETVLVRIAREVYSQRRRRFVIPEKSISEDIEHFKLRKHRDLLIMDPDSVPNTIEQRQALEMINSVPRVLITGCTGSGKTWLALSAASRLAQAGHRTLLTSFNRTLADYLTLQVPENANLVISSFHALCLRMAKQARLNIPGGWNARTWEEKFPEVLARSMACNPDLGFDAIVVDDAQEFKDKWWYALEACLKDPLRSRLYVFMDDNAQTSARQRYIPDVDLIARLTLNLRSPISIAPFLSPAYSAPCPMRFVREAEHPIEFYTCHSEDEVKLTLKHVLKDLLEKNDYVGSEIAILTHRLPRYSEGNGVKFRGAPRVVRRPTPNPGHTILNRPQTFLGLESRAVIAIDLDDRFAQMPIWEIKEFVYSAFSRFTERLIILGTRSAWRMIDSMRSEDTSTHGRRQKNGMALRNYSNPGIPLVPPGR